MAVAETTRTVSNDLQHRRDEIETFIDHHFGSQRAFCEATGLKPARVSKALQDRYISNRRVLPLEHAIDRWKQAHGASTEVEDVTVPVYGLNGRRLRPRGEREPVGYRGVAGEVDRDSLVYVEVTFTHHAVVELIDAEGVPLQALQNSARTESLEYAGLVNGQWSYITVRFDDDGVPSVPGNSTDVTFFGRAVMKLDIGQ